MHFCEDFPKVYPKRATCLNPEQDLLVRSLRCVLGKKHSSYSIPLHTGEICQCICCNACGGSFTCTCIDGIQQTWGEFKNGRSTPRKIGWGCAAHFWSSKTLTLFMTKICDFPCPIYDLTKNLTPYLRPLGLAHFP